MRLSRILLLVVATLFAANSAATATTASYQSKELSTLTSHDLVGVSVVANKKRSLRYRIEGNDVDEMNHEESEDEEERTSSTVITKTLLDGMVAKLNKEKGASNLNIFEKWKAAKISTYGFPLLLEQDKYKIVRNAYWQWLTHSP